jgi:hypothetical protein
MRYADSRLYQSLLGCWKKAAWKMRAVPDGVKQAAAKRRALLEEKKYFDYSGTEPGGPGAQGKPQATRKDQSLDSIPRSWRIFPQQALVIAKALRAQSRFGLKLQPSIQESFRVCFDESRLRPQSRSPSILFR